MKVFKYRTFKGSLIVYCLVVLVQYLLDFSRFLILSCFILQLKHQVVLLKATNILSLNNPLRGVLQVQFIFLKPNNCCVLTLVVMKLLIDLYRHQKMTHF